MKLSCWLTLSHDAFGNLQEGNGTTNRKDGSGNQAITDKDCNHKTCCKIVLGNLDRV